MADGPARVTKRIINLDDPKMILSRMSLRDVTGDANLCLCPGSAQFTEGDGVRCGYCNGGRGSQRKEMAGLRINVYENCPYPGDEVEIVEHGISGVVEEVIFVRGAILPYLLVEYRSAGKMMTGRVHMEDCRIKKRSALGMKLMGIEEKE